MKNILLLVDPQNDFCEPSGALFVPGAVEDCARLSSFLQKNKAHFSDILVTLDLHPNFHIAHPVFWIDKNGKNPEPYTTITYKHFEEGLYRPAVSSLELQVEKYLLTLENKARYNLTVWPPHCLMATWGACVQKDIYEAISLWEKHHLGKNAEYINKAPNPYTEHYSAVQAEVPIPSDPSTQTNFTFIDYLKKADQVYVAGEALSHCVANTLRDLCVYIPAKKVIVLTDCTSPVKGFEDVGLAFVDEYSAKGMLFKASTEIRF